MSEKFQNVMVLVCSTFLGAIGQFAFKYSFLFPLYKIPIFVLGIAAYGLSTVLYFYVLSRIHLSWAYSMGGLSYIFVIIFAALIERVPFVRIVGTLIIACGVFLIGLS